MERRNLWEVLVATGVAALLAVGAAAAQDKKGDAKAGAGPFGLPTLAEVKEKCKTDEEQNKKLEKVFTDATANEEQTRKTARENGQNAKDLEKFLSLGRVETINKVKEVLNKDQQKTFDEMAAATDTSKKKKKK